MGPEYFGRCCVSSILLNKTSNLPDSEDLLNLARLLITGRMVQAIITPHGFDSVDNMEIDEEDEEGRWEPGEIEREGKALSKLVSHCRSRLQSKSLNTDTRWIEGKEVSSPANLFGSVGRAILPFARSTILMMRACSCAIKNRQRRNRNMSEDASVEDKVLDSILDGSETLTTNDGMFILKEMKGPLPSTLIDESSSWWPLLDRWVTSAMELELHHGSRGQSILGGNSSTAAGKASNDDDKMTPVDEQASDAGKAHGLSAGQKAQPLPSEQSSDSDGSNENNMDHDGPARNDRAGTIRFLVGNHAGAGHLNDSDEDLIEDMEMDEAEEMVDFADQVLGNPGFSGGAHASGGNDGDDSADEPSSSGSDEGEGNDSSYVFAGVGQSPIVSYQPSLLATQSIGPGRLGSLFEAGAASAVMADLSHLGLIHRKGKNSAMVAVQVL